MKPKRIVNKKLIEEVKSKDCVVCGMAAPVDAHHLKSLKSGGHDIPENLLPACRYCHSNIHSRGLNSVSITSNGLRCWLESNGWAKEQGKWRRWK